MKNGKYNEAVYMPKMNIRDVDVQLRYTYHALDRADAKGIEELPQDINFTKVDIVEMEVWNDRIYKVLARMPYDEHDDLILVILIDTMKVKTVWLNSRNDNHKTLRNKSQFVQEPRS